MSERKLPKGILTVDLWRIGRGLGALGVFGVGVAGLLVDEIPTERRWWLAVAAVVLAVIGWFSSNHMDHEAAELRVSKERIEREFDLLRQSLPVEQGTSILRAIARSTFTGDGAGWRLTAYLLDVDGHGRWILQRIARVSSSPRWEASGRDAFPLEFSYFRAMDASDITDTSHPYWGESGELPEWARRPEEWLELQSRVVGADVARTLTMKSVKYAWCAAREEDGERRVVCLMAESMSLTGIRSDSLASPLMQTLLTMILRSNDARIGLDTAVAKGAQALGLGTSRVQPARSRGRRASHLRD